MNQRFDYSAVIRTLGKSGHKYQQLLESLSSQSQKPSEIIVYIAEGYTKPSFSLGIERYCFVKKGMVAQRALQYDEVTTEYILFLDDDVYLPPNSVEHLFNSMTEYNLDVISPDVFENHKRPLVSELRMLISGRMAARRHDNKWGYKVMRNSGYSYNKYPTKGALLSQTNAGPCFLCKKNVFLSIRYSEELWLDKLPYALGDDQVMFYKMHLLGLRVGTSYDSGIVHLDAGSTIVNEEKNKILAFCDIYFKIIFWHRFIFLKESSWLLKVLDYLAIGYFLAFSLFTSLLRFDTDKIKCKWKAISSAISFINSKSYKYIPRV